MHKVLILKYKPALKPLHVSVGCRVLLAQSQQSNLQLFHNILCSRLALIVYGGGFRARDTQKWTLHALLFPLFTLVKAEIRP